MALAPVPKFELAVTLCTMQAPVRILHGAYRYAIVGRNYSVLAAIMIAASIMAAGYNLTNLYMQTNCARYTNDLELRICDFAMRLVSLFTYLVFVVSLIAATVLLLVYRAYRVAPYVSVSLNNEHDV